MVKNVINRGIIKNLRVLSADNFSQEKPCISIKNRI